jgi:hypothetical protein
MTTNPHDNTPDITGDAKRLLGILSLQLMTTDDSNDIALETHMEQVHVDLGWERAAYGWELIACIAVRLGISLTSRVLPTEIDDLTSDDGIPDQITVFHAIVDQVRKGNIELGAVVNNFRDSYSRDPDGLAWALFTAASRASGHLGAAVAVDLGLFDQFGEGDLEPNGIARMVLEHIAHGIKQVEKQLNMG